MKPTRPRATPAPWLPAILAIALVPLLPAAPGAAETETCFANADAFIWEHSPDADASDADLRAAAFEACHAEAPCDLDNDGYVRSAPLLRFNLYAIPPGSTLESCQLHLECRDFSSYQHEPLWVDAFRVTSSWTDTVAWYSKPEWSRSPAPSVLISDAAHIVMDDPALAEIAQAWVDGTAYNYGLLLWPEDHRNANAAFYSIETASAESLRPFLIIQYAPPPPGTSPFFDLDSDDWAYDEILACFNAGIVQGYWDRYYRPDVPVLRDQMAVYIARALAGGDAGVPDFAGAPSFWDVPADHWALKYVEYAADAGVVVGYEDGSYHPEYQVGRGQMAVYIARARQWVAIDDDMTTAPELFPDVPAGYWAGTAIQACLDNNVVQGYGDGYYRPEWDVTRDQMAVYIARAFQLM